MKWSRPHRFQWNNESLDFRGLELCVCGLPEDSKLHIPVERIQDQTPPTGTSVESRFDEKLTFLFLDIFDALCSTYGIREPEKSHSYEGMKNFCKGKIKEFLKQEIQRERERLISLLPKEIDCDESGEEMPEDPGLAADQMRNYTIREIRNILSAPHQEDK